MRLTIAITSLSISLDDCFAAIPGCWPGRALPTSGYPQPGHPRSGCALGPFVPHAAHAPMRVSRTASRRLRRSSHTRLQQPASRSASGRVLSPPYAAVRPNARSMGGVVSVRHARPAAHTLRAVVWAAAVTCSSAPVQPISQRGRQRPHRNGCLAATARHRLPSPSRFTSGHHLAAPTRSRLRAATAPLATRTRQLHQRAPAGSWQPT